MKSIDLPEPVKEAIRLWEQRSGLSILREGYARAALSKLFWKGSDPVMVLNLLRLYSGRGMDVRPAVKRTKRFRDRLEKLCRRLTEDAAEVRAVDEYLALGLSLPRQMERFVDYLRDVYIWELNSTVLARRNGRPAYLLAAVRLVTEATGKQHYPELTELVRILSGESLDESTLRKNVENYEAESEFTLLTERDLRAIAIRGRKKWDYLRSSEKILTDRRSGQSIHSKKRK